MERFARIRQSSLLITLHTLCPRTGRFRLAVRMISPSPSPNPKAKIILGYHAWRLD